MSGAVMRRAIAFAGPVPEPAVKPARSRTVRLKVVGESAARQALDSDLRRSLDASIAEALANLVPQVFTRPARRRSPSRPRLNALQRAADVAIRAYHRRNHGLAPATIYLGQRELRAYLRMLNHGRNTRDAYTIDDVRVYRFNLRALRVVVCDGDASRLEVR